MPVTQKTLEQDQALRERINRITDGRTRALAAAWSATWEMTGPALQAAVAAILAATAATGRQATVFGVALDPRLLGAMNDVEAALTKLTDDVTPKIVDDALRAMKAAMDAQPKILKTQLPTPAQQRQAAVTISFDRVDDQAVEWMQERVRGRVVSRMRPLSAEASAVMRSELTRGIVDGSNPNDTARRMVNRTPDRIVDGAKVKGFDGGFQRATTIARTETLDAMRNGAQAVQMANRDVLTGWYWSCSFTTRTCAVCISMHGTEFPPEAPGPEGHPRCRCARVPKASSWADLGFDGIEEPEGIAVPSARDWFDTLSVKDQTAILGPTRLQALRDGTATWDDFAVLKHNPDWRDSWALKPVRDLPADSPLAAAS